MNRLRLLVLSGLLICSFLANAKNKLYISLVFDDSYENKKNTLDYLYKNNELDLTFKKIGEQMMFYFQGNSQQETSLEHSFNVEGSSSVSVNLTLSGKSYLCDPGSRIAAIKDMKDNSKTVLVVDYNRAQGLDQIDQSVLRGVEIKQAKFDDAFNMFEQYYKKYSKELKLGDIHIIFWWPNNKSGFELKTGGKVLLDSIQFGELVNLNMTSQTSGAVYHVNWYQRKADNRNKKEPLSSGKLDEGNIRKNELSSDHGVRWTQYSVVEHVFVCAEIEECKKEYCLELKPSQDCDEMSKVKWRPDYKIETKEYVTKNRYNVEEYGLYEIRQAKNAKLFRFVIDRQCGVLEYELEYRLKGGESRSIKLERAESGSRDYTVLVAEYKDLAEVFDMDINTVGEPVMHFKIVPKRVVKKFEDDIEPSLEHTVLLQKCN